MPADTNVPRSQLDAVFGELRSGVYGNPHSGGSPSSAASLDKVGERVKRKNKQCGARRGTGYVGR